MSQENQAQGNCVHPLWEDGRKIGYEVGYKEGFEAAKEQIIELARAKGVKPFIFPEMPTTQPPDKL